MNSPNVPSRAVSPQHSSVTVALRRQGRLAVRRWTAWFALSVVTILFCIAFVDQPAARLMHEYSYLTYSSRALSLIPVVILAGASISVILVGLVRTFQGEVPLVWRRVLFAGLACCVALTFKTEAKYVFGRLGPGDWYWHQTLPFAGFHPFHRDGSFPSGHMTAMWSIAPFVWVRYRWMRIPWVLASLGASFALMAAGAHFVSDLIAGCLLGGTVGYLFLLAAERPQPAREEAER